MKPFKPTYEQVKLINRGVSKLWIPMNEDIWCLLSIASDEDVIQCNSPLQSNEEYFVQQSFFYGKGTHADQINYIDSYLTEKVLGERVISADQMTESQSRFKFKVTNVEIKQAFKLSLLDTSLRELGCYASSFIEWHNEHYPNELYNKNLYGFLISIERI